MTTRDPRKLAAAGRTVSVHDIVAQVPLRQRLEVAARLLTDEVRQRNGSSPTAPLPLDAKRLSAISQVIRAANALRQRLAESARIGSVDAISLGYALSERQSEILKLFLYGLPENDIAERLGMSRRDARVCVREIYRALGVSGRCELMVRCLRDALVDARQARAFDDTGSGT